MDNLARALSAQLSQVWGQPVVVDNRPGGNEVIGAAAVAKAPGDGYTLLLATDAAATLNLYVFRKLPYDPVKELAPITRVAMANMAIAVSNTLPVTDLRSFVAYVKAHPGQVSYGSAGVGNGTHLSLAWFAKESGIEMVHVPYKGLAPALQDVMAGTIQLTIGAGSVVGPFAHTGKVRALAISGKRRASILPNVPTFAEAGFPKFDASFPFSLLAPGSTPEPLRQKIYADVKKVVMTDQFRSENLEKYALDPVLDSPQEFAKALVKDRALAAEKVKASGAQLE
ncbi:tripartite tricarboxylate transporter substrate binding protein [Cupriavidus sp. AcVe19-1a]|uniref:Bug family tripartite tricarboxylate transporter substrate binding protein n=1 Tax=Cupriavidus sp. AcVe19-1a TaxID=2821359 RepID=UPI001AEACDE8|nr:tripartite tricarboxylate transporter substrate binding protein [Cupriavidus sp. AcVe19-1a]